jgi:hypothetical protein
MSKKELDKEQQQKEWDEAEKIRAQNEEADIKKACDGLDDCENDIEKFKTAILECPKEVDKIIKLIECYNKHNDEKIVTSISKDTPLLTLFDNEKNLDDFIKAQEWLKSLESEQNKSENDDNRHAITSRKSVLGDTTKSATLPQKPWYALWAGKQKRTRKKMTRKTKHSRKKRRTKYMKKNKRMFF